MIIAIARGPEKEVVMSKVINDGSSSNMTTLSSSQYMGVSELFGMQSPATLEGHCLSASVVGTISSDISHLC